MAIITKSRYWWAVMYPENMIDNWQNLISSIIQYPFAYCIHDKDLRKERAEERKTHIHLIVCFNNTTTYNHALTVFSRLNAEGKNAIPNNRFEACVNVANCYDYLIHDTSDCREHRKHLYDKSERITGNNFDIGLFEQISIEEKMSIVHEISVLVRDNFITNFSDLQCLIMDKYPDDKIYWSIVAQYSAFFERFTKGNFQKMINSRNEV